ncbi:hypothetical protein [Bradyrhizobium sp.]|nr:hypothetical protein [Bradyrhizobium sp.]
MNIAPTWKYERVHSIVVNDSHLQLNAIRRIRDWLPPPEAVVE